MIEVEALQAFEHGGARHRGDRFTASPKVAQALADKRLVRLVEDAARPRPAAGATSSASPAAPVSPQTIAQSSKRGGRKKKAEA